MNKNEIKIVLKVILRRKTTSSGKNLLEQNLRQRMKTHAIARAGDNIHVIRSQSSQSRKFEISSLTRSRFIVDGLFLFFLSFFFFFSFPSKALPLQNQSPLACCLVLLHFSCFCFSSFVSRLSCISSKV